MLEDKLDQTEIKIIKDKEKVLGKKTATSFNNKYINKSAKVIFI